MRKSKAEGNQNLPAVFSPPIGLDERGMVTLFSMPGRKSKVDRRNAVQAPSSVPAARAETPPPPSGPLMLIRVLALLGFGIGTYLSILHYQTGADELITAPFCEAGALIDCKSVLNSAYATLFGLPVALWAAGAYAVILALAFIPALIAKTQLLILTCVWMFVFALYMASISFLKLQSVCLLCAGLYLVNIGLLVGAMLLIRSSKTLKTFNQSQLVYGLAGCAVLIGGISVWQTQQAQAHVSPLDFIAPPPERLDTRFVNYYNQQREVAVQGEERHVKGAPDALLTITEFVDFRCPSCAFARDALAQLYATNPGDVRIVFHHYPLDQSCNPISQQVHPSACAAAIASECASDQDRFWEYADRLFADQKANPRRFTHEDLTSHAEALDLDAERFNTCLDDPSMEERIRKDVAEGHRLEIKATPTLIINGRVIEGLPPAKKLATLVTMAKQQR